MSEQLRILLKMGFTGGRENMNPSLKDCEEKDNIFKNPTLNVGFYWV
ncbi:hypothetical protein [Mannheimia granulomatis]|nr:hypothetical protein [Mannheimia granulomatis]